MVMVVGCQEKIKPRHVNSRGNIVKLLLNTPRMGKNRCTLYNDSLVHVTPDTPANDLVVLAKGWSLEEMFVPNDILIVS